MKKMIAVSVLSASLSLSVLACGGDASAPGVEVSFENEKLSALTPAQTLKVCEDMKSAEEAFDTKSLARFSCAVVMSFDPDCSDAKIEQCVAQAEAEVVEDISCDIETVEAVDCDATVGEFFDCAIGTLALFEDIGSGATCGSLDDFDGQAELPAACEVLEEKCPALVSNG